MLPHGKPKTIHFLESPHYPAPVRRVACLRLTLEKPRNASRSVKSNSARAVCLFYRTFNVNQCNSYFYFLSKYRQSNVI